MAWPSGSNGNLHGRNGSYSRAQLYGGGGGAPYGILSQSSSDGNISHRSALARACVYPYAPNPCKMDSPLTPWNGGSGLAPTSTIGSWKGGLKPKDNINVARQPPLPVPMYVVNNSEKRNIVIRDKTHAVRRSYVEEHPKFEKDIVGYMADKTEENIPDSVVEHLINYINNDFYTNVDLLDEVCLYLLANALSVSSVNAVSIRNLSNWDWLGFWDWPGFIYAVLTVLTSDNADGAIRGWLRDVITRKLETQRRNEDVISQAFQNDPIKSDHPEAWIRFQQLLHGKKPAIANYRRV